MAGVIFILTLIYRSKFFNKKYAVAALIMTMLVFGLTLYPLRELFINRTTLPTTTAEEFSLTGRIWLTEQAILVVKEHPFLGVGAGSFIIQLAQRAGEFNFVEPVHNIPLLVASELGVLGFILLIAIAVSITRTFLYAKNSKAIMIGALLMGLAVISLLDHYLWTLAPGRLMLGFVLGLWEGQVGRDE